MTSRTNLHATNAEAELLRRRLFASFHVSLLLLFRGVVAVLTLTHLDVEDARHVELRRKILQHDKL